eukprot:TRINITY_DN6984_c0_g1_i3.p1 TRINITY_DN6984_c0_g1~~TRINITY_DN6984_c0_g1_i3.p1  ORF type:complete len:114 (+),score=16.60 TRINITY_DN6984_c0_g1_i3:402-743(+)
MLRVSLRRKVPFFDYLSDEIVLKIYVSCETEDMIKLGMSCKRLLGLTSDRFAWEFRLEGPVDVNQAAQDLRSYYIQQYLDQNRLRKFREAAARITEPRSRALDRVLDKVLFFK